MKNKHLVLIFLLTVVIGLLARRLPWRMSAIFQADLIEIDTNSVKSISISRPGVAELLLERSDEGWVTDLGSRPVKVPDGEINAMLETLAHVQSIRIIKTTRPDTLGLDRMLTIKAVWDENKKEVFHIGKQTIENGQPATYIELDNHEGIYLVKNYLREVFDKNGEQFRSGTAFQFASASVSDIAFYWSRQDSSSVLKKNDSLALWERGDVRWPEDSVRQWLELLPRLNGTPFADYFDDSRERQTLFATLTLKSQADTTPLELRFFYYAPPELPEEISSLHGRKGLSPWILHSSQNPSNYFSIHDTVLLRHILYDLSR